MFENSQLREILDARIKSELNSARADALNAILTDDGCWSDDHSSVEAGTMEPHESPFLCELFLQYRESFETILKSLVLARLSLPHCCTLSEITDLAMHHLFVRDHDFDQAWKRFRSAADILASPVQISLPFPLPLSMGQRLRTKRSSELLWYQERPDTRIHFAGAIGGVTFGSISLQGSSLALRQFEEEVRGLLSCVIKSHTGKGQIDIDTLQEWLAIYFGDPKKSTFSYRLRSALQLLIEADAQRHDAIGLALCVAALEAVLGSKPGSGEGSLAESVAQNVAVLLEPDVSNRVNAHRFVKKLYDARSRILHGDMIRADAKSRAQSRALTCAVMDRLQGMGLDLDKAPDEFFSVMRAKFISGQKLPKTMGSDVCKLWRTES